MRATPAIAGALAAVAVGLAAIGLAGDSGDAPPAGAPPEPRAAAAPEGLDVWVEHGCGGCHALEAAEARGVFGPDLTRSAPRMSPSDLRTAIVAPDADVAAGYGGGMMPDDYAKRIPPAELDRLVAFLRQSGSG